jgi:ribosome recycling factor
MSEIVDLTAAERRMQGALDSARREFSTIRTGRANPAILDRIEVEAYGSRMPLRSVANVNVPEPRLLTVTPFDPGTIKAIERAIDTSDIGLNPQNDGKIIRLPVPELTEDRRKQMVKRARNMAEESRVSIRNVRRDEMRDLQELKKMGEISEDDERRAEAELQQLTSSYVARIDATLTEKEAELLEV